MNQLPSKFVNQIVCCDASVGIRMLPDECIPLTVTSPPYDDLRTFGGTRWDFEVFQRLADGLWRVTAPGGVVVWIVGDTIVNGSETCTSAQQKLYFREVGFRVHHTMIMDRTGSRFPAKVRYGTSLEYAYILSKGFPRSITLLKDRANKKVGKKGTFSRRQSDGRLRHVGSSRPVAKTGCRRAIWRIATGMNNTTKDAFALMNEGMTAHHILTWSRPGDLVFDPMAGAATTCKMALLSHRKYLGFEIHEPYYRLAQRRMTEAHSQYDSALCEWLLGA